MTMHRKKASVAKRQFPRKVRAPSRGKRWRCRMTQEEQVERGIRKP